MIEAVILAAGESRRMGRIKPLLRIGEKTALSLLVESLAYAGIPNVHIVVGYKAEKVIKEAGVTADFVINDNFRRGQFSSLQCGIRSLDSACSAALICLADQPHIHPSWIVQIVEEKSKSDALIIRPVHAGKSGHPVLLRKELFAEIIAMPATSTAKELMRKYADRTAFADIKSDGILYDADTPSDFQFIHRYIKKHTPEELPPEV